MRWIGAQSAPDGDQVGVLRIHNVRTLNFRQTFHFWANDKKRNYCLASVFKLFPKLTQVCFSDSKAECHHLDNFPLASINLPNNLACIGFHHDCGRERGCWHNTFWSHSPESQWAETSPYLLSRARSEGSWLLVTFEKAPRNKNKTIVCHFHFPIVLKATHPSNFYPSGLHAHSSRSSGRVTLTRKMSAEVLGNLFISSYF